MGGQLFGVQRITCTTAGLGLEQSRVGIAQQLFGTQGIAGKQADADTGADKQALILKFERLLHHIDEALRQRRRLADLRTLLGQHGELVAAQARQGHTTAQQRLEALADHFQ
ncbi:hypothetical protein D3C76_1222770 [compost metagenome]